MAEEAKREEVKRIRTTAKARFTRKQNEFFNPFTPKSDFIDFTLSNARRFYSSKGDPLGVKGLKDTCKTPGYNYIK